MTETYGKHLVFLLYLYTDGRNLRLTLSVLLYLYTKGRNVRQTLGVFKKVLMHQACKFTGVSELPFFDFSLWDLFCYLDIKDLILLFTSVLLEHQILLYSSGKS